jgi:hypothetical protein
MLFAALVFDRMPLQWSQLPNGIATWVQAVGTVSAFGIAIVLLARALQRDQNTLDFLAPADRGAIPDSLAAGGLATGFVPGGFIYGALRIAMSLGLQGKFIAGLRYAIMASAAGYILFGLLWLGATAGIGLLRTMQAQVTMAWIFTISAALALGVVLTPLAIDLCMRISVSRIWAIARLSWKEAVRGRVIWVFGAMTLVFLFAEWFLPYKPEDQIRNYVSVVYLSMTVLFLITAGLLGSFSIPNDVKNNSIHTIVTKPVEKFEIVLGRFLGYAGLLTIGLLVVSVLSLVYVERGVNEEAQNESYKARVPLYGNLHFAGTKNAQRADSVGREWGYRSYITGRTRRGDGHRQFAIWDFATMPSSVLSQESPIVFEFSFDIFRLSKGVEGKGVNCTFTFVDAGTLSSDDPNRQALELESKTNQLQEMRESKQPKINDKYDEERSKAVQNLGPKNPELKAAFQEIKDTQDAELEVLELELIKHFRIYQVLGKEVTDQHTQRFEIPAKYFQALVADSVKRPATNDRPPLAVRVFVSVDVADQAQMVGVAPQDFYLLSGEKWFWQNFLKGVLGLWCTHMLVLGVALAMSTYFSSVISLLSTFFLFIAGLSIDYLKEVAEGKVDGGGPLESLTRIATRLPIAGKLEASPTTSLIKASDSAFSWWIGWVLNLVPDLSRHNLNQYVANGFDIGWMEILFLDNALPLFGYLLPWAIMAYYLMKFREIANPT